MERQLPSPIRHHQSRHALKLSTVRRNERRTGASRLTGDQHIIRTDGRRQAAQMSADVGGLTRIRFFESKKVDSAARDEERDLLFVRFAACAMRGAIHQLVIDDHRHAERRSCLARGIEFCAHRRLPVVQQRDDDVRVEMNHGVSRWITARR